MSLKKFEVVIDYNTSKCKEQLENQISDAIQKELLSVYDPTFGRDMRIGRVLSVEQKPMEEGR